MITDERHYHVDSIELVGCPPIGDLTLRFTNGVNIIVGENGSGKSTLIEAIRTCRWPHGGSVRIHDRGNRNAFEDNWTNVLINEFSALYRRPGQPADYWTRLVVRSPQLLPRVSAILGDLIRNKVSARVTKFQGIPWCGPDTFALEISEEGWISVHAGPALRTTPYALSSIDDSINALFRAAGEQFLIHISGVLAAREYLGIDCPLILDNAIGWLDEFHRESVMNRLHILGQQVLVFENGAGFHGIRYSCRAGDNIVSPESMNGMFSAR